MVIVLTENTKNNSFIQVKPIILVVILTSVTIIKQGFLRKLLCYESLVDIEVSKH